MLKCHIHDPVLSTISIIYLKRGVMGGMDEADEESQPLEDRELLLEIIRAIVEYPASVMIDEVTDDSRKVLTIRTHPVDCGKVIGKEGRMAEALRVLFNSVGTIQGYPVAVRIIDMNKPKNKIHSGLYRSPNDRFQDTKSKQGLK